jgi:hypothetical protein
MFAGVTLKYSPAKSMPRCCPSSGRIRGTCLLLAAGEWGHHWGFAIRLEATPENPLHVQFLRYSYRIRSSDLGRYVGRAREKTIKKLEPLEQA